MINDRRRFDRVCFESLAKIQYEGVTYTSKVEDLSLKGALVIKPNNFNGQVGNLLTLSIFLTEEININMECSIVYIKDIRIGLCCNHIDIDSVSHLKRLVELNIPNCDVLLERNLENFADLGNS